MKFENLFFTLVLTLLFIYVPTVTSNAQISANSVLAVGTLANVGEWNADEGKWKDQGPLGGWYLKMLTFDSKGDMWCVGTEGNVGKWNAAGKKWDDQGLMGGWYLKMLTFDSKGDMWCVGTSHNVGKWNAAGKKWDDQGLMGGWSLKMLTFDSKGNMWCVGTEGNVGKWNAAGKKWDDQGRLGGWSLKMLTFDSEGQMYGVGTSDNLGVWDAAEKKWEDQGLLAGWKLNWISLPSMKNINEVLEPIKVTMTNGDVIYVSPVDNGPSNGVKFGLDTNITDFKTTMTPNQDFAGEAKTEAIVAQLGTNNGTVYAAKVCADLVAYGFDDWYLPAAGELHEIYKKLGPVANGGSGQITTRVYWSSSEYLREYAWVQGFGDGKQDMGHGVKVWNAYCRCVRR